MTLSSHKPGRFVKSLAADQTLCCRFKRFSHAMRMFFLLHLVLVVLIFSPLGARFLAAVRIDAAALQSVTADFLLEKHSGELTGIVRTEPPLKTKPYYLMLSHQFSKKYPELPDQIWRAVAELREEKLDALAKSYLDDQPKVVEIKTD